MQWAGAAMGQPLGPFGDVLLEQESSMSTDLKYLAFTAMLTAALWIPYVVCQVMTNGFLTPPNYVDPTPRPVPAWGRRADRRYLNAVEPFAPFAALGIVVHLAAKAKPMNGFCAALYVRL